MAKVKTKLLVVCIVLGVFGAIAVSPAEAVTVLYQRPGVNPSVSIYLNESFNSLEFENPPPAPGGFVVGKHVKGYKVLDWRDADYSKPGYPLYGDWTRCGSGLGLVDGCNNEVWMRQGGQAICTTTRVSSTAVSIHLTGDNNDGKAEVRVDGTLVATLDMGTRGNPQRALIIVKYLPLAVHTIKVDDVGIGPSGLGNDVATMGACALAFHKWFPHFWYLDCRLRLLPTPMDVDHVTPISVTVPNGWWGGWWWWHHQCCWFRPWYGPIWRYRPYYPWPRWRWRLYWYHWPFYKYYYGPWWNYWKWHGGPWFWGFKKCFHYTWRPWWPYNPWPYMYPWRPPIIYMWSWYWDPGGQGNCVEMFTMANEDDPAGGRILPVTDNVMDGLNVTEHNFNVNNKIDGDFGQLEWVEIGTNGDQLRNSFANMTGADANDVNDFMDSDIVKELINNAAGDPGAKVGMQYATWTHTDAIPALEVTAESIVINESGEGSSYEYNVVPTGTYTGDAQVSIIPSSARLDVGAGPGVPRILEFNSGNWETPQPVNVTAENDDYSQGTETLFIGHTISTDPNTGVSVQLTLQDDDLGRWGFVESDLDFNGKVNFYDVAIIADEWLSCTDPDQ